MSECRECFKPLHNCMCNVPDYPTKNDRLDWTIQDNANKAIKIESLQAKLKEAEENIANILGKKWSAIELALAENKAHKIWMVINGVKRIDDLKDELDKHREERKMIIQQLKTCSEGGTIEPKLWAKNFRNSLLLMPTTPPEE